MQTDQTFAFHCHSCRRVTTHQAAAVKHQSWSEITDSKVVLDHELEHALLICIECRGGQLRSAKRIEQLSDEWSERYHPPHPVRQLPDWVSALPSEAAHIGSLLEEVHAAFAANHFWLVAMGCRTLIDMFAVVRVGDVGGFEAKLDRLEREKFLSQKDRLVLKAALEVGHEATHRSTCPSPADNHRCLDIVENLLHRLVIAASASAIQEQRPTRT